MPNTTKFLFLLRMESISVISNLCFFWGEGEDGLGSLLVDSKVDYRTAGLGLAPNSNLILAHHETVHGELQAMLFFVH